MTTSHQPALHLPVVLDPGFLTGSGWNAVRNYCTPLAASKPRDIVAYTILFSIAHDGLSMCPIQDVILRENDDQNAPHFRRYSFLELPMVIRSQTATSMKIIELCGAIDMARLELQSEPLRGMEIEPFELTLTANASVLSNSQFHARIPYLCDHGTPTQEAIDQCMKIIHPGCHTGHETLAQGAELEMLASLMMSTMPFDLNLPLQPAGLSELLITA